MRLPLLYGAIGLFVLGCSQQGDEPPAGMPDADMAPVDQGDMSSATVFDLHADDRAELEERAISGDAEASFRLAQFYTFSGDGGPSDSANERRWLELATAQGHRTAQHNLAVVIADEDCARAVRLMEDLVQTAATPDESRSARGWLEDDSFQC